RERSGHADPAVRPDRGARTLLAAARLRAVGAGMRARLCTATDCRRITLQDQCAKHRGNSYDNTQCLCRLCNQMKGAMAWQEFLRINRLPGAWTSLPSSSRKPPPKLSCHTHVSAQGVLDETKAWS